MNRIITLLIIILTTGLLLPSCGISLEKRQHTGGYYVNVNPRKQAAKEHKTAPQPEEAVAAETVRTSPEPVAYEKSAPTAQETPEAAATQELAAVDAPVTSPGMEAAPATGERPAVRSSENRSLLAQVAERSPVKKLLVKKGQSDSAAGHSGEALSLLWIVILILLILWIAGLISGGWGIGWAINVLLVIALVLLILWLLRIV